MKNISANIKLNLGTMNDINSEYFTPEITILDIRVEAGFAVTGPDLEDGGYYGRD